MLIDFQAGVFNEMGEAPRFRSAFQEIPVRIMIGDVDLLGVPEEDQSKQSEPSWYPLQIPNLARWGLASVQKAQETGRYVYELGRYGDTGAALLFKRSGADMLIHSTMTDRTVRVSYHTLLKEWKDFAERVRNFVSHTFPEMKQQQGWSDWLTGQEEPVWSQPGGYAEMFPFWQRWFNEYKDAFQHVDAVET